MKKAEHWRHAVSKLPVVSKRLLTKTDQYNDAGIAFSKDFENLIAPIFLAYAKKGYSLNELQLIATHVMHHTAVFTNVLGDRLSEVKK